MIPFPAVPSVAAVTVTVLVPPELAVAPMAPLWLLIASARLVASVVVAVGLPIAKKVLPVVEAVPLVPPLMPDSVMLPVLSEMAVLYAVPEHFAVKLTTFVLIDGDDTLALATVALPKHGAVEPHCVESPSIAALRFAADNALVAPIRTWFAVVVTEVWNE